MMHFNSILQALEEERLVPFIGSGFSKECNFPDWKELVEPIAKELKIPLVDNTDYSLVFQYYQDKYNNRNKLNSLIADELNSFSLDLQNHKLLADLPVSEIWTTNYDKSIETYFNNSGRKISVKKSVADLSTSLKKVDCTLYKMHGDLCNPNECVLTKDDYERYFDTHEPFINILKHTLIEKTVLFIGYSLNDPDFQSVLSGIRKYYTNNFSTHYWVIKKESDPIKRNTQELFEKNLLNYGVKTIAIDDYSEITKLLNDLLKQSKKRNVFISGASIDSKDESENKSRRDFIRSLALELIKRDYTIFNGFGLNVGASVIEGAYSEIYSKTLYNDSRERIKIYPFWQQTNETDDSKRKAFQTKYRNEMLHQVGVAIFIYGTKYDSGKTVLSSGMKEEFEIAKNKGIFLIPVCCTGGMAAELWNTIYADLNLYSYNTSELKDCFEKLKSLKPKANKDELIEVIFTIMQKIQS